MLTILMLAVLQGHALYYGSAQLADAFFEVLGAHLPYRVNVADHILDLSSADVAMPGRCVCGRVLGFLGVCVIHVAMPYRCVSNTRFLGF